MTISETLNTAMTSLQAIADGGGAEAADAAGLILFLQTGGPFQNKYAQMLIAAAQQTGVPMLSVMSAALTSQQNL